MSEAKPVVLRGRAWVIADDQGRLIDDIDTDMIFHNAHLAITDIAKMGPYAFGNLQGWEDFPKKAKPGDILILGKNFGSGSSRQQAVDCFTALGVQALVAESFGAIYKRNTINCGMPLLCREGFAGEPGNLLIKSGDEIELNLADSTLKIVANGKIIELEPFSKVQMDIYQSGGLYAFGKTLES